MLRLLTIAVYVLVAVIAAPALGQPADPPPADGSDAEALFEQGKAAYRAKDFQKAVDIFRDVIAADPSVYEAHVGLGRALERLKKYDEAVKAYEEMMEAHPDKSDALARLGIVYRKMERYEDSIRSYRKYIEANPDDPDPWYGMGESLRAMGDKVGSLNAYQTYAEMETRPSEQKYVKQAQAYAAELQKEIDEDNATAEAPDAATPPGDTGEEQPDLGEKSVAVPDAEEPSVEKADVPAETDVSGEPLDQVLARGDSAFDAGEFSAAAAIYRDASNANPQSVEAAYKAGVALAVAKDYGAALDYLERARALAPELSPAEENYERIKRRLALDASLDPPELEGTAEERRALAQRMLDEGRYMMAIRAARALTEVAPQDPAAQRILAESLMVLDQYLDALDALETELALQPGDVELYALLGRAHDQVEQVDRALYFYELFLSASDATDSEKVQAISARVEELNNQAN